MYEDLNKIVNTQFSVTEAEKGQNIFQIYVEGKNVPTLKMQ